MDLPRVAVVAAVVAVVAVVVAAAAAAKVVADRPWHYRPLQSYWFPRVQHADDTHFLHRLHGGDERVLAWVRVVRGSGAQKTSAAHRTLVMLCG